MDGEPNASDKHDSPLPECFPPALRFRIGPDGAATGERSEPIAADAREDKDGEVNAKLKLIAGVLGVNFDALKQRERQRRWRNLAIGISLASLLLLIISTLGAVSFVKRQESARRLVEANHNLVLVFNEKADLAAQAKRWNESRLYSLLALARFAPGRDKSLLLRGNELKRAEVCLSEIGDREPRPTCPNLPASEKEYVTGPCPQQRPVPGSGRCHGRCGFPGRRSWA